MEDMRKLDWRNPDTKGCIQVSPSAIADLQRRLRRAEIKLGQKEEENAAIRQQLQQFDTKWSHYEAKMKYLERLWQDQLTSLQMSLAAAKNSLTPECTADQPKKFDPFPFYNCLGADDAMPMETQATDGRRAVDFSNLRCDTEPQHTTRRLNDDSNHLSEQHKKVFRGNSGRVGELKSVHLTCSTIPDEELRKLKVRFEAWKKDYKTRLQETTATLHMLGQSEAKKSRMKWWRR